MRYISLLFIFVLLLTSCNKDPHPRWDVQILAPIVHTRLTMEDLLGDTLISSGQDDIVHIFYEKEIFKIGIDSVIDQPDTINNDLFQFPFSGILPPSTQLVNSQEIKKFDFAGIDVRYIIIESGKLRLEVINTVDENIQFAYSIPAVTFNNAGFNLSEKIPANTLSGSPYTKNYDISGYYIDMRGPGGTSSNKLLTNMQMQIDPAGDSVYISNNDSLRILVYFTDLKIFHLRGFFGTDMYESELEYIDLDIFNNMAAGNFDLSEAQVRMILENKLGLDFQFRLQDLGVLNTHDNLQITSDAEAVGSVFNIERASELQQPGQLIQATSLIIDLENSNVTDLFEIRPDKMYYDIELKSNPLGNSSMGNDFAYSNHNLTANIEIDIPLNISATNLQLSDTSEFIFNIDKNYSYIEKGNFNFIAENNFPFDADIQIYVLKNGQILDSLFTENETVSAAQTDATNNVIAPVTTSLQAVLDKNRLYNMDQADDMIIQARLNTVGSGNNITFYNHYYMDIQISGDFTLMLIQ